MEVVPVGNIVFFIELHSAFIAVAFGSAFWGAFGRLAFLLRYWFLFCKSEKEQGNRKRETH